MITSWLLDQNKSGSILFIAYFLLYGLEYIIPLVRKKSRHFAANVSFAVVLIALNVVFTSSTFTLSEWIEANNVGLFHLVEVSTVWRVFISVLFLDFWAGYLAHYIFHKNSWLWKLHSVHHSDELVDVTTTFRQHPIESLIRISFNFSGMVILGIPAWILLIYLTLSTINAQIEHANIRLPATLDRFLQYIIVTPNMHKVHHSKYQHETDSNYSNIFSFWDRIFNTFKSMRNYSEIQYGLDYLEEKQDSFWKLLSLSFKFLKGK